MLNRRIFPAVALGAIAALAACGGESEEPVVEAAPPVVEPAQQPGAVAVPVPVVPGSAVPNTPGAGGPDSASAAAGMDTTRADSAPR